MTGLQFDTIVSKLNSLEDKINKLESQVDTYNRVLNILTSKAIVISDVDKELEQLKLDVKSLKDEMEV